MGTSRAQKQGIETVCKCGCDEIFIAFPVYRSKSEGGGLRIPDYKRGHHPNCRKNQTGTKEPWNKGLKKSDHPSIERMGFQKGHPPYMDWSHVNERLSNNLEFRKKWLENKRGQIPWNYGLTKDKYPNGIAKGESHGNWKGGNNGFRDLADWKTLRNHVFKRDNWTCQHCGDKSRIGRGSRMILECHHIVPVSVNPSLSLVESNLVTLCPDCHLKAHGKRSKKAAP